MKFLSKINLQYLIVISLLLFFVSILGYFTLKIILQKEMKEDIYEKEYAIIQEIKTENRLPNLYPIFETKRVVSIKKEPKSYQDIYLKDEAEDELEPYVEYTNTVEVDGEYYVIKIRHSLLENDDLIMAIALPLLFLLVLALIASFFMTKKLNKTLWKDFEENLRYLESFSFNDKKKLNLKDTGVLEFDKLNTTLEVLTDKLQSDYEVLKQFTENASHEIQTPLAIVLLNLEELLQIELPEQSFKQLHTAINGVKRLSSLNKSLILLSKIENKQFTNNQRVQMNDLVARRVQEFEPLLEQKKLKFSFVKSTNSFWIDINEELAEILINNLLSNAIKHNVQNGEISIEISEDSIQICNTGAPNSLDNDTIFNRFTKENSQSYGLGLAIAQQICGRNHLEIIYLKSDVHCFKITK
jgi:signal transduction histidine kinase